MLSCISPKTFAKILWCIIASAHNIAFCLGGLYLTHYWPVYGECIAIFHICFIILRVMWLVILWCNKTSPTLTETRKCNYYILLIFFLVASCIQNMVMLGRAPNY